MNTELFSRTGTTWLAIALSMALVQNGGATPYAEAVIDSNILSGNSGNSQPDPQDALDAPDGAEVSMGGPGAWMILDMGAADPITDGPGADLEIRETGAAAGGQDESYDVFISNTTNLASFVSIGTGRAISLFDISASGLTNARYVRIVDLATETLSTSTPGSDIDSLTALHSLGLPTGSAELNAELTCQGILLSWDAVVGADEYYIRRSLDGVSYPSSPDVTVDATATAYHDLDLPDVTNLWYALSALSNGVESAAAVAQISSYSVDGPLGAYHLGDNEIPEWDVPSPTNIVSTSFELDVVPPGPRARFSFEVYDVDHSRNYVFVNGINLGGLPTHGTETWSMESLDVETGILKPGVNVLEFHARTSGGSPTGSLDDYMIRNVQLFAFGTTNSAALPWVVGYSPSLTPAIWEEISEPIRWNPNATNKTGFFRLQFPE